MEIILKDVKSKDLEQDGSFVVPPYITIIGEGAFEELSDLKKVYIPKSVKMIEKFAFQVCDNLEEVLIQEGALQYIGDGAFIACRKLKSIKIPKGVTKIGNNAFASCECLDSVVLPSTLKEIHHHAFSHCQSLKTISIPMECEVYGIGIEGYTFDKTCDVKRVDEKEQNGRGGFGD